MSWSSFLRPKRREEAAKQLVISCENLDELDEQLLLSLHSDREPGERSLFYVPSQTHRA